MERSSPSRTMGIAIRKVTVGETEYVLDQPDRVRRTADEEAVVISRRQVPANLSDEDRASAMAAIVSGFVTAQEWSDYTHSYWHIAFRFWNALCVDDRMRYGKTTGNTARGMLQGVQWAYDLWSSPERTLEEFADAWAAIAGVSQEEELKNSSGCPPTGSQPTDTQSTAATQQSSPSS